MRGYVLWWGRKDGFPGADGSTITQVNPNAETIPIYGATGEKLLEDEDGYCKVNITVEGVLNGNNTLIYAIKNPMSFIYNKNVPKDWYTDDEIYQNNALWGDGENKSNYDPCPAGWCASINGTWSDFSMESFLYYNRGVKTTIEDRHLTNGRLYKDITWYPAIGYRAYLDGALYYIGNYGYTWSATTNNTSSNRLSFGINDVSPNSHSTRAFGCSVRCVQE